VADGADPARRQAARGRLPPSTGPQGDAATSSRSNGPPDRGRISLNRSAAPGISRPRLSVCRCVEKQVPKLQVCCAGHGHRNALTGGLESLGTRLQARPRPPREGHPGVLPRGIANDQMTVEAEVAGRIDGIADADGWLN
jgi:hypothetical protein